MPARRARSVAGMDLPLTSAASDLLVLPTASSTNDELTALVAGRPPADGQVPEFTVVLTTTQTAGRGRLGRAWVAPAGSSLAMSVLIRPASIRPAHGADGSARSTPVPITTWGWIPLMAGVAMTRTVAELVPGSVSLKWPNDVHIEGRKVCGILAELVPTEGSDGAWDSEGARGSDGAHALVLGVGLNLSIEASQLPTESSTSLTVEGARLRGDELVDAAASGWLGRFRELYTAFVAAGGDAESSGVASEVSRLCSTIGRDVRVALPSGAELLGVAVGLDATGGIRVRVSDGSVQAVAAGDVTHLRYE